MLRIVITIFCIHFSFLAGGQIKLCKPGDSPTNNCRDACLFCNLNGLKGRNTVPRGTLPGTFCTPTTDNAQWIPFVAGSRELTLEIKVTDCVRGSGLEMGLFNGSGCSNFAAISSCFTDVNVNNSVRIVSVLPLSVGEIYWLLLDGNTGDVCSWEVKVTEGSATAPELKEGGTMFLPAKSCINQEVTAFYTPPPGTKFIEWKVNNTIIDNNNKSEFKYTTTENGTYTICATASNACHKAPTICKTVTSGLTKTDTLYHEICAFDKFVLNYSAYSVGNHLAYIKRINLCDSVIYLKIRAKGNTKSILKTNPVQIESDENFDLSSSFISPVPKSLSVKIRDSLICSVCNKINVKLVKNDTLLIQWINDQNCKLQEKLILEIVESKKVLLPNIIKISDINSLLITPYLFHPEKYKVEGVEIYNRWGNIIHSTFENIIDLKLFCSECKEGVYTWKILLTEKSDGKKFTEYKSVTFVP